MRIVMVTSSFLPSTGGVETHVEAITKELLRRGHKVTVLVRHTERPARLHFGDATVYRLPAGRLSLWIWLCLHIPLLWRAEVIHSHDYFLFELKRLFPKKRFVHTFHGYEGYPIKESAIVARQAINQIVDASVAAGGFIEKWYGTKCDLVTYGGIDPIKLKPVRLVWDVIYYGRLEPDTGIKEYLDAFRLVVNAKPEQRILIVGTGSLGAAVDRLQSQHPDQIEVRPTLPHEQVLGLLNQSRIACVSGYLAILEAAYMGKMIVANYNTPIKKDYLACHPLAQHMVIAETAAELASGIDRLLSTTPYKRSQTSPLRDWAQHQTWSALTDQYLKLYQSH